MFLYKSSSFPERLKFLEKKGQECITLIYIDQIGVEVFGKTVRRTEMIDHSFERKFDGVWNRLCQKLVRGLSRSQRARKVLNFFNCSFTMMLYINRYENYTAASNSSFQTSGKFLKRCNNQMIRY